VVAVLGYHRIGPPPPGSWETWFSVPEDTFLAQLEALAGASWEPVTAADFVAGLDDPDRLPPKSALITFDDAFRSLIGSARECLARLGYPAAVFVPVAHVGGTNSWDENTAQPSEPICTWDDLRTLDLAGISVQSHGLSHRSFSSLDREERARELEDSKTTLEAQLGTRVELLAYPYGDPGPDDDVEALAEQVGYRAAFLYGGGGSAFRLPALDRFRLPRIAVGPDTDLEAELARAA
jgi:peptidoglycan/xylan/chitin deacetylase (PgdA/CDA1 family)